MVCLKLNWFFCCLSRMLDFSEFVWTVSYSVWDVFNRFLLIDTTDRSKISSDQKRFFIALSLYPLSFFANTPFNFKSNLNPTVDASFSTVSWALLYAVLYCTYYSTLYCTVRTTVRSTVRSTVLYVLQYALLYAVRTRKFWKDFYTQVIFK